ncbi:hypothetical protein GOBAR_AA19430 [Gossypium barbadense]|uniref:anthranilate synthase n=1 Tax=Gossypium barbadense TaxID=3634 RepID=A0A2P5XD22_GOSBA|nr:hypothetical protein GOBAR_AA19430 [Gossypium barbadense]
MAANIITQSSLLQPKPALSAKTLQIPSLHRFSGLPPPSRVGFFLEKKTGIVGKAPLKSAVSDSTSSVLENKKNSKNPIVVIDNYDSFTYNLCQYIGELGCYFEVFRNDELTVEDLKMKNPRGVLISPGPGTPQDSGISLQTVLELGPTVPLFGVCMGLQCIGEAFGESCHTPSSKTWFLIYDSFTYNLCQKIVRSPYGVMHGKSSPVYYDEKGEDGLLTGLSKYILLLQT